MRFSATVWKWIIALLGLFVVLGSAYSARYLMNALAEEERKSIEMLLSAERYIRTMPEEEAMICDITFASEILQSNTTTPLLLVNPAGEVISGRNFGEDLDEDQEFLEAQLAEMQAAGVEPVGGDTGNRIYFQESSLLRALRYFPFVQLALIASFVFLGYLALSAIRKSEQNRVWVGMAKETAHQLGTPISAIMAWVEYLRAEYEDNEELNDVADELSNDVNRLQLVAERFNKIGSTPDLQPVPLGVLLDSVYSYMSKRAPRKVDFSLNVTPEATNATIGINTHLFEWVLENLIRNALDAMDGKGELGLNGTVSGNTVEITVSDTGKGIPANKRKTVFRPGYTTKSRGWGLGLSLAKRIVEDYHGGKIFVKDSAVGRGTTFAVRIPVRKTN